MNSTVERLHVSGVPPSQRRNDREPVFAADVKATWW